MKTKNTVLALALFLCAGIASAERLYVVSGDGLYQLDATTLNTLSDVGITGLQLGEQILDIDFRPADRRLYGVSNQSRLYRIDTGTGAATLIGGGVLSVPITGVFGIDFNPVADALRIVSSSGQNLRVDPATGAVTTDTAPQFAAGDANDGLVPFAENVAYTNSYAGAKSTTLYTILGQQSKNKGPGEDGILTIQNPPNAGTLNTVGYLNFDGPLYGLDISPRTGIAYLSSGIALYQVNLTTGEASSLGEPNIFSALQGLAVEPVPEPSAWLLGLSGLGVFFGIARKRNSANG